MELALKKTQVHPLIQILLGSVLLALTAQISIPLWFSPVPISLAPTMAVFLGIVMGPKKGALAAALYLLEGAVGLPVFTFGRATIAHLIGPTGGYLVGYLPSAFLAGLIVQKGQTPLRVLVALILGHLPLYMTGVPHLAQFVGWDRALVAGCYPFLPGCLLKSLLFASGIRLVNKRSKTKDF